MRLRNKDVLKLSQEELNHAIDEVRRIYIDEGEDINFLISYFDSTKTFMYNFLREHNIVKSKEQIQKERSERCKKSANNKTSEEKIAIKEKRKKTNLERFGVENTFQSEEKKEKIKKTCLERYGVEYANQSTIVKQKIDEANIKSQGAKRYTQTPEGLERFKATCRKKYGVDNPYQSEEKKLKSKETCLKRYGVEHPSQNEEIRNRSKITCQKNWGVDYASQSKFVKDKIKNTNLKKYGVPYACLRPECILAQGGQMSNINKRFAELLDDLNIEYKQEFSLGHYSYDFKINDYLIEINPTYTHNSTRGPYFNKHYSEPKNQKYHFDKSTTATDNGFHCIHVFDWDNYFKILNMFSPKQKIYARNCEIKEVSKQECNFFLNDYHLQNTCKNQNIRLGLYYNNELMQIMTFGKPRYNKNYEYELLRLCSHKDYIVIGGSERLFSHFKELYNPRSIISYCDVSKFSGTVYERLGMDLKEITKPSCHWSKGPLHITQNLLNQRGADQLIGTNYGKGTSNRDIMIENEWLEVYDCGQKVYEYTNF